MLTTPTDHKIVVDAGIDHGFGNDSSEIDSVSHDINKAMDIVSVISGASKTSSRVMRIASTSEEEGNSVQIERRSKRRADAIDPIATVVGTSSSLAVSL